MQTFRAKNCLFFENFNKKGNFFNFFVFFTTFFCKKIRPFIPTVQKKSPNSALKGEKSIFEGEKLPFEGD